jgi:hypothetical protein
MLARTSCCCVAAFADGVRGGKITIAAASDLKYCLDEVVC